MNSLLMLIVLALAMIFFLVGLVLDRLNKIISLAENYIKYKAQVHILHEERYANTLKHNKEASK